MCLQGEAVRQQNLEASSIRIHPRHNCGYWQPTLLLADSSLMRQAQIGQ